MDEDQTPLPKGISRRDWFAAHALAGLAGHYADDERVAKACYRAADAMIAFSETEIAPTE